MKIICVDNYDREDHDDDLIAENVGKYYAEYIVRLLNNTEDMDSPNYFKAVEDNYQLKKWEP